MPSGLDRPLVPVPGEPLDADDRDVAAEAAEPLDERHVDAGPRRAERGGEPARARADDEHVGAMDDVDLARGLGDAHRV